MNLVQVVILGVIQGLAELLPVSSSAHVIVAEKLFGLDPSSPEMTFLLVMLHTGTMVAVLLYFWPKWRAIYTASATGGGRFDFLKQLVLATAVTGVIGLGLKVGIEHTVFKDVPHGEVEQLFANLPLMAASLFAVGLLIIVAGRFGERRAGTAPLAARSAALIGAVQGLCLPFRGFSRSGATISVGMLLRLPRDLAEAFSFALAVLLTPAAIFLEVHRLLKATAASGVALDAGVFLPGLLGMVASFAAGLGALRWLSAWLEAGRWHLFGYYCLTVAAVVAGMAVAGY